MQFSDGYQMSNMVRHAVATSLLVAEHVRARLKLSKGRGDSSSTLHLETETRAKLSSATFISMMIASSFVLFRGLDL